MGNFVTGNTPLPPLKVDANPPVVPEKEIDAADVNNLWAAAGDLRTAVLRPDASFVLSTGSTTPRTLADRFRDVTNVKDYGLVCDGVTNDYPALAAMLTLLGSTPATLLIPGPCLIGTSITIPATLPVRFEGAGAFTGAGTVTFTRWTPGGSQVGASSLFTTAPRPWKSWTLNNPTVASFNGTYTADPGAYGSGSRAVVSGTDRHWLQFTLPSTVNGGAGYAWHVGAAAPWTRGVHLPKQGTRIRVNQLANGCAFFALAGSTGSTQAGLGTFAPTPGGSHSDNANFLEIRYDSRSSANWIVGSGDSVTGSWIDSGIPVTITDDFLLVIEYLTASSFKATITNCTSGASGIVTKSTNMPSSTISIGPNIGGTNWVAAANVGPYFEYVYMEHN